MSENGEPKQVDSNTQSLKKAMISFQDINDGHVEILEDSQQIDEVFKTLLSMEDNFQLHLYRTCRIILGRMQKGIQIKSVIKKIWQIFQGW